MIMPTGYNPNGDSQRISRGSTNLAADMPTVSLADKNLTGFSKQAPTTTTIANGETVTTTHEQSRSSVTEAAAGRQLNGFTEARDLKTSTPVSPHAFNPEQTVVTVPGVGEMTLNSALNAGFAEVSPQGQFQVRGYQAPGAANQGPMNPNLEAVQAEASEPEVAQVDPHAASFDETTQRSLDIIVQHSNPGSTEAAFNDIIQNGEISEGSLSQIAKDMGVDVDDVSGVTDAVIAGYSKVATDTIVSIVGPGLGEIIRADIVANGGKVFAEATTELYRGNSTAGFKVATVEALAKLPETHPELVDDLAPEDGHLFMHNGVAHIETNDGITQSWANYVNRAYSHILAAKRGR